LRPPQKKVDPLMSCSAAPSPELDRCISEVRIRYSHSMPIEAYEESLSKLPWTDYGHFDQRLTELGYVVTGFAATSEGQELVVAVSVLKIGISITLVRMLGRADSVSRRPHRAKKKQKFFDPLRYGFSFQLTPRPDDEIWEFSSSLESWQYLAGRAGAALVRDGTVIDACVTALN
jgi:hypothetical protein